MPNFLARCFDSARSVTFGGRTKWGSREFSGDWMGFAAIAFIFFSLSLGNAWGSEPKPQKNAAGKEAPEKEAAKPAATASRTGKLVNLNESGTVQLDVANKRLVVKAEVVLTQGGLEMFACRKKSKEHESILAIDADAFVIHSGLLALKAKPGGAAEYEPEFKPPHGQKLEVTVRWLDEKGDKQEARAQSWVRETIHRFWALPLDKLPAGVDLPENSNLRYDAKHKELLWYGPMTPAEKKEFLSLSKDKEWKTRIEHFYEKGQSREMQADWVFVGSILYEDEATGRKGYAAEEGMYLCVSNFSTAMIDVAMKSSDQKEALAFEAYTERIPPKGTKVTVEIIPQFDEPTKPAATKDASTKVAPAQADPAQPKSP